MSYEAEMLKKYSMPSRQEVEKVLLITLFNHNGIIKEFGESEDVVNEIANYFSLNNSQRKAELLTIYKKENREKRVSLWHRLLFRAADKLANQNLISRPSETVKLTNRKEWMLTEDGIDESIKLSKIPISSKDHLLTKSYESERIVKKLLSKERPTDYIPYGDQKKKIKVVKEITVRERAFRITVIEAYDCKCAVCNMKISDPSNKYWEVEAAHIVPHSFKGRDDVWNGISLCRLHHWAFDVGWFTINNEYFIVSSPYLATLPKGHGIMHNFSFIVPLIQDSIRISLPKDFNIRPHENALKWHRDNIFYK